MARPRTAQRGGTGEPGRRSPQSTRLALDFAAIPANPASATPLTVLRFGGCPSDSVASVWIATTMPRGRVACPCRRAVADPVTIRRAFFVRHHTVGGVSAGGSRVHQGSGKAFKRRANAQRGPEARGTQPTPVSAKRKRPPLPVHVLAEAIGRTTVLRAPLEGGWLGKPIAVPDAAAPR
jgi:hypothetical protein